MSARLRRVAGLGLALLVFALAPRAVALGTPVGTVIQNTANVTAVIGGVPVNENASTATTVIELLDVDVTLQNASNVLVRPGDIDRVLTFRVTNLGNGVDDYLLGGLSMGLGGDFDPVFKRIVLDNGNGIFEDGIDADYIAGTNDPVLDGNDPANDSIIVFGLNDIPGTTVDDDLGLFRLRADSNAGVGAPGNLIPGGGDGGVDAMIGAGGGSEEDFGTYEVTDLVVAIAKTSTVDDGQGGNQPIPMATITYQLVVSVTGADTAQALVIRDPIPANTTYVADSIVLNGVPQTDANDSPVDESFFDSGNNEVVIGLGDLPGGSPDQTITFQVTID